MSTESEILWECNLDEEERKMWRYCYRNARTSHLIEEWKKKILASCRQGLEVHRERGCRVSVPCDFYVSYLGAMLSDCQGNCWCTKTSYSVDKLVLAIMKKIGAEIQEELYPKFGDTYMDVDWVEGNIVFCIIKMRDYRRYLGQ